MSCLPCFQSQKNKKSISRKEHESPSASENVATTAPVPETIKQGETPKARISEVNETTCSQARSFTFRELATATKNFRQECLLGEGGFGKVFKGTLASNGQVVAIKQLDRNGMQGNYNEFLAEVEMLSLLRHPNLVPLIGYCADGDQRLLVYELLPEGSLDDHLLGMSTKKSPLDWIGRIKIALGAAQGLQYLHEEADPPIIYRDLKPSNILLDKEHNPKLSDYGLAKLNPSGAKMHVVMGTYGYCAPEYARASELTLKSDVYSFGVILLELITGRRALDTAKPTEEQNLVSWAQPIFRDPKRFPDMADPLLNRHFPEKDLNQAVAIAAMCLQEEAGARPLMSDVVTALSFLSLNPEDCIPKPLPTPPPPSEKIKDTDANKSDKDSSDSEGSSSEREDGSDRENEGDRENKRNEEEESSDGDNENENGNQRSETHYEKGNESSSSDDSRGSSRIRSMSRKGSRVSSGSKRRERSTSRRSRRRKSRSRSSSRGSEDEGSGFENQMSSNSPSRYLSGRCSTGSNDRYESFCERGSTGSQNEKLLFHEHSE